jgi:hypothetical protein
VTSSGPEQPPPPGIPGVPYGASTTYIQPGFKPPSGWAGAREPGFRVRLVPNETLLPGPLGQRLGELTQILLDEGADAGVSVEIDTSDRTRPGEQRGGASPVEGIALMLLFGAAGFARRELERLGHEMFDAVVGWALRHRRKDDSVDDPISVTLYGPDGAELKRVYVPQGRGDSPPYRPEREPPD